VLIAAEILRKEGKLVCFENSSSGQFSYSKNVLICPGSQGKKKQRYDKESLLEQIVREIFLTLRFICIARNKEKEKGKDGSLTRTCIQEPCPQELDQKKQRKGYEGYDGRQD